MNLCIGRSFIAPNQLFVNGNLLVTISCQKYIHSDGTKTDNSVIPVKIDCQLVVLLQTPVEDGMFSLLARAGRQVRLPSVLARIKSTAHVYEANAFFCFVFVFV